jgi:hypothetical protein
MDRLPSALRCRKHGLAVDVRLPSDVAQYVLFQPSLGVVRLMWAVPNAHTNNSGRRRRSTDRVHSTATVVTSLPFAKCHASGCKYIWALMGLDGERVVGGDRGDQPLRRKRARATTPPVGVLMHSPGKALSSAADAAEAGREAGRNGCGATGTREGSEESTLAPTQPADIRKGVAARTGMAATATTGGAHGTPKADMAEAVSVLQVRVPDSAPQTPQQTP